MALASASDRARSERRMWKARRCAVLGPTLGSRDSSWISSSRAAGSCAKAAPLDQARGQAQARRDRLHPGRSQLTRPVQRLVHCRHHQVLKHLDVAGHFRIDRERDDPLLAVDDRLYSPAPSRRFNLLPLKLCLHLSHTVLDLLHLLEHFHVLHQGVSFNGRTRTTLASSFLSAALITGSSSGASGGAAVA